MKFIVLLLTTLFSFSTFADIAVIVNKDNTNDISSSDVRKIFLQKIRYTPDGTKVKRYNYTGNEAATRLFNSKVLKKDGSRLNSYWARMLFSSKGAPPKDFDSADEIKQRVASNKSALSFINVSDVDDSVKVLFTITSK